MRHCASVIGWTVALTVLAGAGSSSATPVVPAARQIAGIVLADIAPVPIAPKPFAVPAQPIVAASSDGYLPSSWSVTPKGAFTFSLPLTVPPGRAGMEPTLSLEYTSTAGDGIVGTGWSVTGFSTITRGGRSWAAHGTTSGVRFDSEDRFYLDGQELIAIGGAYGGNGTEYRTEPDTFVRVRSTSTTPLDAAGPEQFTVEPGDGRVLTYAAVMAPRLVFSDDNTSFTATPVRAEWRLIAEQDANGNAIAYEYQDTSGPGGSNARDYWFDSVPSKIFYTANLTNGVPTHGTVDLPWRSVTLEYEPRPDATSGWSGGVQRRHDQRLKALRMYAPNPAATALVWEYDLAYTTGQHARSLLASVQRCEAAGGCVWAKQFTYSAGPIAAAPGPEFLPLPRVAAPIAKTDYDLSIAAAPDGEVPALQTLDLNGDGASDVLFGPGKTKLWETLYSNVLEAWVPDGTFLGGGHSLWLSARKGNGAIAALDQGLSLPRDEEPLSTAHYGHVRLDESSAVDLDGDGKAELVAAIDNLGAAELDLDPNLPPMERCSVADLKWTPAGFEHVNAIPCTLLATTDTVYRYYLPNEFPTFADFNGDGLPDRAWSYNNGGWIGSNNPNDPAVQFDFAPAWQVALNTPAHPGTFAAPVQDLLHAASPGVVTDLDGDGRAELTYEALKSSLTLDANGQWTKTSPDSMHLPSGANGTVEGYREFGDFNGDGTQDVLLLTVENSADPGTLTGRIHWNTGHGFYADGHVLTVPVDVHPDRAQQITTRFADPGLHVTDIDNDGRMDLVVFNNDHEVANQPSPQILFLLSEGDGTFKPVSVPVGDGTRDDVKYWIDNALRPIQFYPSRLENDTLRLEIEAFGQVIPGAQILLQLVPFENYLALGPANQAPGLAAGWNLATLADVNGDGWLDVIRHVGGNDAAGGFEVLEQTPQTSDELVAVTDAATAWPVLSIAYASEWSDRPEVNDSYPCSYPLTCPRSGLRVAREVTSRLGVTDVSPGADPLAEGHTWRYAYRDPVANVQGLGFFGFSEVRRWDAAPDHPQETITTYDLRTPEASGRFYPGVGVPATVTVAQPILLPGQGQPASASARLATTHYTYEWRSLNGGATHALLPQSVHASAWEAPVSLSWSGTGADHLHVFGYAEPANPPIHADLQLTYDDYGNLVESLRATAKGLKTDTHTPVTNDLAHWQLGEISERSVMTLESAKNAVPVWRTTAYTYTPQGQLETITIEPYAADPTLTATTTLVYDDYGQLTDATTLAAGAPARSTHFDYATAWAGAPDEHLYASTVWSDHADPACAGDCRPAAWTLMHPAYGVPIATLDRHGVQTTSQYDAHGRLVNLASEGELPLGVTYGGRADTFGGMNGLAVTTTQGLQQTFATFAADGATLRTSMTGFDGQWINTFTTYDGLGRPIGVSRPNAGAPAAWTSTAYDSLNRAVATTYPDGSGSTIDHTLFGTSQTDPAGHVTTQDYDVDGRLVASSTVLNGQTVPLTYAYGATTIGPLRIAIDAEGHATTRQYDRRERPVSEDEPSRGLTKATYTGFGDLQQTEHVASGAVETSTYDDLGRLVTTTSADGLTTYTWDLALNGLGRLARATSPDQIRTDYRYDAQGRLAGIDQTDELGQTASMDVGYDAQTGQVATLDYPQAPGQASRLRIAYDYNGYGYLRSVSDATPDHPVHTLQQITTRNADLALVDAVRGDGAIADHRDYDPLMGRLWMIGATHAGANRLNVSYGYDADGLVDARTRTDETVQIDETFGHDALHRLTGSDRHGQPLPSGLPFATSLTESYDRLGNRIDTWRDGALVEHRNYGSNASPYALTSRTLGDPAQPNAPTLAYQYDSRGRLVQDAHRQFTWTAFDLPRQVIEDGRTWAFAYGAGGERVKKQGPDETIRTFAGLYEKHETRNGVKHVYHVAGSDGPVADLSYTESHAPARRMEVTYPLTDALGSVVAVADASGALRERDYYDAWGLRTSADGSTLPLTFFQSASSAGFTDQAHDDDLALINLQGRLYDPALGRFLSPDPIVAHPALGESWNAYSYVRNSPLDFTDPSGFDPCPAGFTCLTAPDNEITNTIVYRSGTFPVDEDTGQIDSQSVAAAAANAVLGGALTFMQDQEKLKRQQYIVDVRKGRTTISASPVRNADGTPVLRTFSGPGNSRVDSWGWRYRGKVLGPGLRSSAPSAKNTDSRAVRNASAFAVRLFCGGTCASSSAPTDARSAANAPKQLSDSRIARNALAQATAVKRLVRWVGKVGVVIDEGLDGVIARLMPDGMGMSEDPKWGRLKESMELRNQRRQIEEEIADKTKRAQEVAAMLRLMPESREAMKRYLEARENLTQGIGTSQDVWQARENLYDAFHRVLGDGEDVWDPDDFTPLDPDP
jgi:RHS repeat-associated protein